MASHLLGTILVIDDEPSMVGALTGLLRRDGYRVDAVAMAGTPWPSSRSDTMT